MVDNAAPSFRPIIAVCFGPASIFDGLSVVCNIAANPNGPIQWSKHGLCALG